MKRLFWLGVGAVAGASGTVWAERKVRTQLDALQPDHLMVAAGNRAISVGRNVMDAVLDGRDAMRDREFELRGRYDRPAAGHRHAEVVDIAATAAFDRAGDAAGSRRTRLAAREPVSGAVRPTRPAHHRR